MYASNYGNIVNVEALLECGAVVDLTDVRNRKLIATSLNSVYSIKYYKERGALGFPLTPAHARKVPPPTCVVLCIMCTFYYAYPALQRHWLPRL